MDIDKQCAGHLNTSDELLYINAIEKIVENGFSVLQIRTSDRSSFIYFVVYKWQEGYFNTAQSVDFNMVEGINITEFLRKNSSLYVNNSNFMSLFNKVLSDGVIIHLEFTKSCSWFKWSAIDSIKKDR